MSPECSKCGDDLVIGENWNTSNQRNHDYRCRGCERKRRSLWRKANPDKSRACSTRSNRKYGKRPFDENRECGQYLGVYIAERVLSHVFKNVERMPIGNAGYDFVCNKGKKIDVKSSCLHKNGCWQFNIRYNVLANDFLCIAFDNREDLTPVHVWLLPGNKFSHLTGASIHPTTIRKWDGYKLDIEKVSACCDMIRGD